MEDPGIQVMTATSCCVQLGIGWLVKLPVASNIYRAAVRDFDVAAEPVTLRNVRKG
jgi:hypothetical protein